MRSLTLLLDKARSEGRIGQDLNKKEIIEALDIIGQNIIEGKAGIIDGNTIFAIRHALMNPADRIIDYARNEAELSMMAASLGRKGGEIITDAKQKASRENGKKGGRPKGSGKKNEE